MSRVLVTGATGFTGTALCRRLVGEGASVAAFVRPTSELAALRALGVECRVVDIADTKDVTRAFEHWQTVYHLAAAYRTEHSDRDEFRRVNVEATRVLLEAARSAGVGRFVHCSTVGVHGEIEDPPADESYRLRPGDHYQESKLEGEQLAQRYFAEGLPGTVVRPVGIYGPGDRRFLKLFRSIQRGWFVMIGDGRVLYHLTYIDDLIDGFLLAASRPEALGRTFILCGPRYTSLDQLADAIAEAVGRRRRRWRVPYTPVALAAVATERICRPLGIEPPLYPRRVEFFALDRAFSSGAARERLGYRPKVDLEEGLTRTARWYAEQGWL